MSIPNPPELTQPPTPPSRADPANFAARGDAFLVWFPTAWSQIALAMEWIRQRTTEVLANSNAATQAATAATAAANSTAVQNAAANAAAAQAAATAAGQYATQAQATNPDSPIRLNPRRISAPVTIPSGYNAASAGPIAIDDGISVIVSPGANWSIH